VPGPDDIVTFEPLPPPTDEDIVRLTERLSRRLGEIARRRLARDEDLEPDPDQNMVRAVAAEALRIPLTRVERNDDGHVGTEARKALCARVDGFSLHAARVVAPHDRQGLERLCRYGLRAPFSLDRLSTTSDGRVRLALLRPWPNAAGRTEIVLDPHLSAVALAKEDLSAVALAKEEAFMRRLAALVPAPFQNLVRYHGVFANRSRLRPLLPKPPARIVVPLVPPPATASPTATRGAEDPEPIRRSHRMSWAALLKRVLDVDALVCPGCGAAMVVLAFLTDPPVVHRILDHLDLPSVAPRLSPAHTDDSADLWPGDHDVRQPSASTRRRYEPRRLPPRAPP
jgi:hypothetical protein